VRQEGCINYISNGGGPLNHPNILATHNVSEYSGAPYLVSELLEGNSLRVELEQGRLGARKAVEYAVQMAQG
jgi:hypothetical protein